MRVFVTGASGWIGSAVVPELVAAGHQVVGLARSDSSAAALAAAGVEVHHGSLDDLESLRSAADASDGVIHLAFKHDLIYTGQMEAAAEADRRAIETFAEVLAGSDRPLSIASGALGVTSGRVATELDGHGSSQGESPRHANAEFVLGLAAKGVRSSIVRLGATVHGRGDNGFVTILIRIAREKGISGYIGDGLNRWPAVHRLDAARLFRLAVEDAPAGSTLHGVAEEGVALHDIAETIGQQLDLPTVSISPEDANQHFGPLAGFVATDGRASSRLTSELLGWTPTEVGLIDDLKQGHYFQQPRMAA